MSVYVRNKEYINVSSVSPSINEKGGGFSGSTVIVSGGLVHVQ